MILAEKLKEEDMDDERAQQYRNIYDVLTENIQRAAAEMEQ